MSETNGIDISHWQDGINIDAVIRQASFVMMKASQGVSFKDGKFRQWLQKIKPSPTTVPGAYHFLESQRLQEYGTKKWTDRGAAYGGAAQARYFISTVKAANGGTLNGVLCALDVENLNFKAIRKRSLPGGVDVIAFIKEFRRKAPGHPLFIYTSSHIWGKQSLRNIDLRRYGQMYLWIANWTCTTNTAPSCGTVRKTDMDDGIPASYWDTKPIGKLKPTIRQWTNNGRLDGKRVDVNSSDLTRNQLFKLTNPVTAPPTDPPPDPEPEPEPEPQPQPEPQPNPWEEPWLDPQTGDVDPVKVAGVSSIATAGAAGGLALLVGAVALVGWQLSKKGREPGIFDWMDDDG